MADQLLRMNLRDCYRASDVKRWQIVKTYKQQSVAEHSYQVALIATRICDIMENTYPGNMPLNFKQEVLWYALIHDMPEVLTGDLATPLKTLLGVQARGTLDDFESKISILGHELNCCSDTSLVAYVVKLADRIEAVAFLNHNAATPHGIRIMNRIKNKLVEMNDRTVDMVLEEILNGRETTLDDYIEELVSNAKDT